MFYAQDLNEHIDFLQINPIIEQVIYSVKIPKINKNDVLQITTEFEATNNYDFNVMIGAKIILADSDKDTNGIVIDQSNGFNITKKMHHGVFCKARNWLATSNYKNKYLSVVIWGISVNAQNFDNLKIEKHYGHLDVFINNMPQAPW